MGRADWDQTMQEELGTTAPGAPNQPEKRTTRGAATRKANRRQKLKRGTFFEGGDILQHKLEARLERLECTNPTDSLDGQDEIDVASDDEYSFHSDDSETAPTSASTTKRKTTKRKPKSPRGRKAAAKKKKQKSRFKKQTLSTMLLDENAINGGSLKRKYNYLTATAEPSTYPPRRLCTALGSFAKYKDADNGLWYANLKALDMLQEHPPPWTHSNGYAPYFEAMRILRASKKQSGEAATA